MQEKVSTAANLVVISALRYHMTPQTNMLVQGDALALLERLPSAEATLAYLDPPWHTKSSFLMPEDDVSLRQYLLFLSQVLQQIRRVLADDGSIFFHSTPTLAGSVRAILDQVFERKNFREEIIWPRRFMGRTEHDAIYRFSKTQQMIHHPPMRALSREEIKTRFPHEEGQRLYSLRPLTRRDPGRSALRYEWHGVTPPSGDCWSYSRAKMDEMEATGKIVFPVSGGMPRVKQYLDGQRDLGVDVGSIWDDLPRAAVDRSGGMDYPSQQPIALLRRIIGMGTNPGNVVLDPFCGSGVALVAAQEMGRRWIGGDNNEVAQTITTTRLETVCQLTRASDFRVLSQAELEREFPAVHQTYRPILLHVGQPSLKELIEQGEGLDLEFKALLRGTMSPKGDGYDLEYACFKTVSALMNSRGGILLIGVKNDGQLIGIENDGFANNDKFNTHFWHVFDSAIGKAHSGFMQTAFETLDGKTVYVVRCQKSELPVFLKHKRVNGNEKVEEFFVRTGPSSERLGMKDAFDYIRKNFAA